MRRPDHTPAASTATLQAHDSGLSSDCLHPVRVVKWWTRLLVYPGVTLIAPFQHLVFGFSWPGLLSATLLGWIVATAGIEFTFPQVLKLTKRSAYPGLLAKELARIHDFEEACERTVELLPRLLGAEAAILAWTNDQGDGTTSVASHGLPPDEPAVVVPPWRLGRVARQGASGKSTILREPAGRIGSESRFDGPHQAVYVPLWSLDRLVGVVILICAREAPDPKDDGLLAAIAVVLGPTLENILHHAQLGEMATTDELTGIFNRRYFLQRLQEELRLAQRFRRGLALLILDLDGLKPINDTYGHTVGDAVLANVGRLLVRCSRAGDVSARIGGDEFAIVMPDTDKRGAVARAKRLECALRKRPIYEKGGVQLSVSLSWGVSGYPWGGEDAAELMQRADAEMYAAKAARRECLRGQAGGDVAHQGAPDRATASISTDRTAPA